MRISSGQSIFGIGAVRLRDVFRQYQGRTFRAADIGQALELDDAGGRLLFQALLASEFVRPASQRSDSYVATIKGNALANATARKPVRRAVATRNLEALIGRAAEVNANPDFLFWVDRLVVFGSYLDESQDVVGDVDVAIDMPRREHVGDRFIEMARDRAHEAEVGGRRFPNLVERLGWAELEVRRFLKNSSTVLSFTTIEDQVLDIAERTELVYERLAKDAGETSSGDE